MSWLWRSEHIGWLSPYQLTPARESFKLPNSIAFILHMAISAAKPSVLWKYRHWDDAGHTQNMITKGELFFSHPHNFNDPFEFHWLEKMPKKPAEIDALARAMCAVHCKNNPRVNRKEQYNHLLADLKERAKRRGKVSPTETQITIGVYCLAERHDDLLMWSHYANQHTGVCLGIDTSALPKAVLPVRYAKERPVLDAWEYTGTNHQQFVNLSLSKGDVWAYEREWRTIYNLGAHSFRGCVTHVIVGARASHKTRNEVRKATRDSGATVYHASLSTVEYGLTFKPKIPKQALNDPHPGR